MYDSVVLFSHIRDIVSRNFSLSGPSYSQLININILQRIVQRLRRKSKHFNLIMIIDGVKESQFLFQYPYHCTVTTTTTTVISSF